MVTLEYYTYSNGNTVTAVLNAVAAFFGTNTFASLISISAMVSVVITTGYFFITRNPAHIYKFAAVFFLVPLMLINAKARMQVIDLTEGNINSVDNVPYIVAIPTYFSTTLMYGFTSTVESIFNSDLAATEEYGKTGMTFGSSLFRLSTKSTLSDITVKQLWSDFFNNCITRDITINKKYTWEQLYTSSDIWAFLNTKTMSPLRGIFVDKNNYKTCAEAKPVIEDKFKAASNDDLLRLGQYIFGDKYLAKTGLLNSSMTDSYSRYASISKNASEIIKQNMTMNAVRNSVNDLGGTPGALNYAYTQNKSQTTAMWASIALQAKEFIPMMHTILFLLFGCASIFVIAAAMIPSLTFMVLTNYVKTFLTLAIWPALFAFLNFLMTTSLSQTTSGVTNLLNGVTLSNNNALDEMHTRFGLIAGYLMMSIPFLAGSIIKGGAAVMSNLSYQLSGMINSTNSKTSGAAASGDLDFGNMRIDNQSYNNLGANKRDDVLVDREGSGISSRLGSDGVTTTNMGNGKNVYDTGQTYSNLGYTVASQDQITQSINDSYTDQKAITSQQISQLTETTNSGIGMGDRLTKSSLDSRSNNTSSASTDSVNVNKGVDKMESAISSIMENTNWNREEARSYAHSVSAGIDGSISSGKMFGLASVSATASTKISEDELSRVSKLEGIQEQEVKNALLQYRDGANMVSDASQRTDATESNSEQSQIARDFSGNWGLAKSQAETATESNAQTNTLANVLSESQSGSFTVGENLVDDFQRYVENEIYTPDNINNPQTQEHVRDILTAQTGDNRELRDQYLADFQQSEAFQLAVLGEALPTKTDLDNTHNQNITPANLQLTEQQQNNHALNVGTQMDTFTSRLNEDGTLFMAQDHQAQLDSVDNTINNVEKIVVDGKSSVPELSPAAPIQDAQTEIENIIKPPEQPEQPEQGGLKKYGRPTES